MRDVDDELQAELKRTQADIDMIRAAAGYTPSPAEVRSRQVAYPAPTDRPGPPPFIDPDTGMPTNFKPLSDEERAVRDEAAREAGRKAAADSFYLIDELRRSQANARMLRELCAPRPVPAPAAVRPRFTVIDGGRRG